MNNFVIYEEASFIICTIVDIQSYINILNFYPYYLLRDIQKSEMFLNLREQIRRIKLGKVE